MLLQISCSIISVRRANPYIDGKSTSVKMRSTLCGLPFSISHAFKPSGTAATTQKENPFSVTNVQVNIANSFLF